MSLVYDIVCKDWEKCPNQHEFTNETELLLGCFNPTLGQKWTNPAIGLIFLVTFLTQRLRLSIFGLKQLSIF